MSQDKMKILNLCSDIHEGLGEIFTQLQCEVFKRGEAVDYKTLDFILVDTEEEALVVERDFDVLKHDISTVCLGQVKEIKKFMLGNGRLSFEPKFLESKLGQSILYKFFKKQSSIHLEESYPGLFKNVEGFKVTNHLAFGSSLDELSLKAFDSEFNLISLRSFLDHTLMYFTYLKQAGLAGVPYEVEYAHNKEYFAVNIHAPVKNFVAEYLVDSFGAVNPSDPLRYLLAVAARSSDFMDVTFVEEPGKVVLNGFWSKSASGKLGGLALNNIKTAAATMEQVERKIKSYKSSDDHDGENKVQSEILLPKSLPGGILEMALEGVDSNSNLGKNPEKTSELIAFVIGRFEEVYPDHSLNEMNEDDLRKILKDYPDSQYIESLSDDDKNVLLERIQKKNITDAYEEELTRVRSGLEDEGDFKKELSDTLNEEVVKRVSSHLDAEALNRILNGTNDKDDFSQTVGGSGTENDDYSQTVGGGPVDKDDFKATVKGLKQEKTKDVAQRIAGAFDDMSGSFSTTVSGGNGDSNKGVMNFVSMTMDGVDALDIDPLAKSFLKEKAPEKLASGLMRFAQEINVDVGNLSHEDLMIFKNEKLPSLIEDTLDDQLIIDDFAEGLKNPFDRRKSKLLNNSSPEFQEIFKTKFEQKLEEFDGIDKEADGYNITDENLDQERLQSIVQETMRESLNEQFKLDKASRDDIETKEKEIIQTLSDTFAKEEQDVKQIVKGASDKAKEKETKKVVENLFAQAPKEGTNQTMEDSQLLEKLSKYQKENQRLSASLKAAEVKLHAYEQSKDIVSKVASEAKAEVEQLDQPESAKVFGVELQASNVEPEKVQALKEGKPLDQNSIDAIAKLVEKEKQILENARNAEDIFKKSELEYQKREAKYLFELQKAQKESKSKDTVVEKIKESVKNLVEKKQKEVESYRAQVEELNQRLADDKSIKLGVDLKALKKEYDSTKKIAEMYKSKVENLLKSQNDKDKGNETQKLITENRGLSRVKIQLENKLNSEIKQRSTIESHLNRLKEQEAKLRARAGGAEAKLKEAQISIDKLKANESRLVSLAEKGAPTDAPADNKELEVLKAQNVQLQNSLKEMAAKLKSGAAAAAPTPENQGAKEKRLEQSVKKLNSELSKAKNEVGEQKKQMMKMKSETTGLKNKLKTLEKQLAHAKKPGSKKAA
ncbi:MAG: hypothetical protein KC478_04750 [Bacteriovoracaceae bacterium]|nr:hypothetical protein [Bacteriovoracaceae bacterium]